MLRRRIIVLVSLVAVVSLASCGKSSSKHAVSKTTTTVAPKIAPLTGLPDASGASQKRSSLTVKIENTPEARPQTGIDMADVVYEEVVEGNITRFATIFNSQSPDTVGPIRSVRGMDPNIVWPLGGVFAYSGGTQVNVQKINGAPVLTIDETKAGDAMFRKSGKAAPHNLFGYPDKMWAKNGNPGPVPPRPLFHYGKVGAFTGEAVTSFTANFSRGYAPTYTWDAASKTWKRAIDAAPFMASDGKQVAPTNVIVQFTSYPAVSEGETLGTGQAWIFSNGQVVKGTWNRTVKENPTEFLAANGSRIELTPGSTFVELLPNTAAVDVVSPPTTTAATTKP